MTRRLLPAVLTLGPNRHPTDQIRDAEAFARHHLDKAFEEWGMYLEQAEYDDSLSLLITQLWRLAERFDQERNDCFANYAHSIIPKRAADVGPRRLLGRNGIRLAQRQHEPLDEDSLHRRHDPPLAQIAGDPDPDRGRDPERLLPERDRERAWSALILGCRAPQRAA